MDSLANWYNVILGTLKFRIYVCATLNTSQVKWVRCNAYLLDCRIGDVSNLSTFNMTENVSHPPASWHFNGNKSLLWEIPHHTSFKYALQSEARGFE